MPHRLQNNFDFLRLLFASLVIVSHSYPLTGNKEIIGEITGGQMDFGSLAVNVFFAMSGYLILTSLKNSKTPQNYLWKRVIRLFPGMLVLLLFTLIIISAIFAGGGALFQEKQFWSYLPNNLSLYRIQHFIKGVFEENIYPRAINGSLWSLSYEFTMYLFVLLFFFIKRSKNPTLHSTAVFFVFLFSVPF